MLFLLHDPIEGNLISTGEKPIPFTNSCGLIFDQFDVGNISKFFKIIQQLVLLGIKIFTHLR